MSRLRLKKLPDRTPVKLVMGIAPDLHRKLLDYAALYEECYGAAEGLGELIPAMLEAFLESDRGFSRRIKSRLET